MKKLIKVVVVALGIGVMLGFTGCGAKTPDKVAIEFYENCYNGNVEAATKLVTPSQVPLVTIGIYITLKDKDEQKWKGAKYEVVETKIDGDHAIVVLRRTAKTGEVEVMDGKAAITLVKQDGEWKVVFNMR